MYVIVHIIVELVIVKKVTLVGVKYSFNDINIENEFSNINKKSSKYCKY
jgi:hypothetical protein